MSRNLREGRYAGSLNGRHYRTRGVNCTVSNFDVLIEIEMRRMGEASRMFNQFAACIGWSLRAPISGFTFGDSTTASARAQRTTNNKD